ncbi:flagellar hook-associated protein FlgK [Pseudohoeflea suaedae]|uniref:Flagellar hook-associated protein 1 n=1 Tax=Pseudohoeflea suaedae TaxID=877384 RepID=A0A4R5PMP2_9HYPH|nr:flagellar hook-associated protein FlgK [Pseudohoeflea suaedae]TDH38280.1 flagellar hook-associated protein FlgK [Pseudohoeflea suaedae]
MSLTSAIRTAQSALSNNSTQTSVVSRNISNANNPDYNRRSAILASTTFGATVANTERSQNQVLFNQGLQGTSASIGQATLLSGLERLKSIFGGNDYETSPASLMASFRDTLSTFAVKPSEATLAESVIADANQLALGLQHASADVQQTRKDADKQIAIDVETLNTLLADFKKANDAVVGGTRAGRDVNSELDERDRILKRIVEIVPVDINMRDANDMALYTAGGLTLFETSPRTVTFAPTGGFDANITGNAVFIDGQPLEVGSGAATSSQGTLQANLQIRDEYAPGLQRQLDEIARGLIMAFAEKDQSAVPTQPDMPGLFTWSGGTMLTSGTLEPGVAASIRVNPALVTASGGNPMLLRDGGINGAAYVSNPTGGAGYSGLLDGYVQGFDKDMTFDGAAGLGNTMTLSEFAADSIGWLEQNRSDAAASSETKDAYVYRTLEAYSNLTGVSLDEEMAILLELEQSYKASTRIISAVDEMLQALLAAAG